MGRYTGAVASITPNTSNDNWTLDAAASESALITEIGWGGEATTTTAMRTRVVRPTSVGTTITAGTVAKKHPHTPTNLVAFATTWSVQPVLPAAGNLIPIESWNAHGGIVRWLAAPGDEIYLIGADQIACRNATGTATSSYGVTWLEP